MSEANQLEMSLDDIIKQNKKQLRSARGGAARRGRGGKLRGGLTRGAKAARPARGESVSKRGITRGGKRGGNVGRGARGGRGRAKGVQNGRVQKAKLTVAVKKPQLTTKKVSAALSSSKLIVNNLHFKVTDNDIRELFGKFGKLKRALVHYDSKAKSLGTAEVVFFDQQNALKAMKKYNQVPLDGRPMQISIVNSLHQAINPDNFLAKNRLGKKPVVAKPVKKVTNAPKKPQNGAKRGRGASTNRGRGAKRGRGGKARGGKAKKEPKAPISAEELDKQLDAYIMQVDS